MTAIKKYWGRTSSSLTEPILAYYTRFIAAANGSAEPDLNLPREKALDQGRALITGLIVIPDSTIRTGKQSDSLRRLSLEHSKATDLRRHPKYCALLPASKVLHV